MPKLTELQQLTSGHVQTVDVSEAFDGKLLTVGADGIPLMMNSDGSQIARFADVTGASSITPCGHFVIIGLGGGNLPTLVRLNRDGTHVHELVSGHLSRPTCSADGQFVFYVTTEQPQKIWRVPIEAGKPQEIADVEGTQITGDLAMSPDGQLLAYSHTQYGRVPSDGWSIAVISATGGSRIRDLALPGAIGDLNWSPDGKTLQYTLTKDGATNIWEQPISEGKIRQLTTFGSGQIFRFNWTSDHTKLLVSHGDVTNEIVLLASKAK